MSTSSQGIADINTGTVAVDVVHEKIMKESPRLTIAERHEVLAQQAANKEKEDRVKEEQQVIVIENAPIPSQPRSGDSNYVNTNANANNDVNRDTESGADYLLLMAMGFDVATPDDTDADVDANANADTDADVDANANANADTDADVDANADTDADTDADAIADCEKEDKAKDTENRNIDLVNKTDLNTDLLSIVGDDNSNNCNSSGSEQAARDRLVKEMAASAQFGGESMSATTGESLPSDIQAAILMQNHGNGNDSPRKLSNASSHLSNASSITLPGPWNTLNIDGSIACSRCKAAVLPNTNFCTFCGLQQTHKWPDSVGGNISALHSTAGTPRRITTTTTTTTKGNGIKVDKRQVGKSFQLKGENNSESKVQGGSKSTHKISPETEWLRNVASAPPSSVNSLAGDSNSHDEDGYFDANNDTSQTDLKELPSVLVGALNSLLGHLRDPEVNIDRKKQELKKEYLVNALELEAALQIEDHYMNVSMNSDMGPTTSKVKPKIGAQLPDYFKDHSDRAALNEAESLRLNAKSISENLKHDISARFSLLDTESTGGSFGATAQTHTDYLDGSVHSTDAIHSLDGSDGTFSSSNSVFNSIYNSEIQLQRVQDRVLSQSNMRRANAIARPKSLRLLQHDYLQKDKKLPALVYSSTRIHDSIPMPPQVKPKVEPSKATHEKKLETLALQKRYQTVRRKGITQQQTTPVTPIGTIVSSHVWKTCSNNEHFLGDKSTDKALSYVKYPMKTYTYEAQRKNMELTHYLDEVGSVSEYFEEYVARDKELIGLTAVAYGSTKTTREEHILKMKNKDGSLDFKSGGVRPGQIVGTLGAHLNTLAGPGSEGGFSVSSSIASNASINMGTGGDSYIALGQSSDFQPISSSGSGIGGRNTNPYNTSAGKLEIDGAHTTRLTPYSPQSHLSKKQQVEDAKKNIDTLFQKALDDETSRRKKYEALQTISKLNEDMTAQGVIAHMEMQDSMNSLLSLQQGNGNSIGGEYYHSKQKRANMLSQLDNKSAFWGDTLPKKDRFFVSTNTPGNENEFLERYSHNFNSDDDAEYDSQEEDEDEPERKPEELYGAKLKIYEREQKAKRIAAGFTEDDEEEYQEKLIANKAMLITPREKEAILLRAAIAGFTKEDEEEYQEMLLAKKEADRPTLKRLQSAEEIANRLRLQHKIDKHQLKTTPMLWTNVIHPDGMRSFQQDVDDGLERPLTPEPTSEDEDAEFEAEIAALNEGDMKTSSSKNGSKSNSKINSKQGSKVVSKVGTTVTSKINTPKIGNSVTASKVASICNSRSNSPVQGGALGSTTSPLSKPSSRPNSRAGSPTNISKQGTGAEPGGNLTMDKVSTENSNGHDDDDDDGSIGSIGMQSASGLDSLPSLHTEGTVIVHDDDDQVIEPDSIIEARRAERKAKVARLRRARAFDEVYDPNSDAAKLVQARHQAALDIEEAARIAALPPPKTEEEVLIEKFMRKENGEDSDEDIDDNNSQSRDGDGSIQSGKSGKSEVDIDLGPQGYMPPGDLLPLFRQHGDPRIEHENAKLLESGLKTEQGTAIMSRLFKRSVVKLRNSMKEPNLIRLVDDPVWQGSDRDNWAYAHHSWASFKRQLFVVDEALTHAPKADATARREYVAYQQVLAKKRTIAANQVAEYIKSMSDYHRTFNRKHDDLVDNLQAAPASKQPRLRIQIDKLKATCSEELQKRGLLLMKLQANEAEVTANVRGMEAVAIKIIQQWRPLHAKLIQQTRLVQFRLLSLIRLVCARIIQRTARRRLLMYCRGEPETDEEFVERMKEEKRKLKAMTVVYSANRPW